MKQDLELNGELSQIVLKSNLASAAVFSINTLQILDFDGEWSGEYFTDYPVTLKCEVQKGYHFVGWESEGKLLSSDEQLVLAIDDGGVTITALIEAEE